MKIYCLNCKKFVEIQEKDKPCPECGLHMCGLEDVVKRLPPYEKEAALEIIKWFNKPPGAITKAINRIIETKINSLRENIQSANDDFL